MFNVDKAHFGYYQVGNYRTFSKLEAIEIEQATGETVHWNFNDEVYSCYDWTKEPVESLEELYIKRAQQIREKYDYIVLLFSAGSDSQNMLQAFVQGGIKFEETLSYSNLRAAGDVNSYHNKELFVSALPIAQKLKATNPLYKDLIVREVDLSDHTADIFNHVSPLDYPYMTNGTASPIHCAKSFIREIVPDYRKLVQEKRVVFVWGAEKPLNFEFKKGKFYFRFLDILEGHVGPRTQMINRAEEHDEFFYVTPDAPLIPIKQCHVIAKFLRGLRGPHPYVSDLHQNRLGHIPIYNSATKKWQTHWLQLDGLNRLIYPWFDPTVWYQNQKPVNSIYSTRDEWFYRHPDLSQPFNTIVAGMISRYGAKWLNSDPLNPETKFVRKFPSREYCVG